MRRQAWIEGWVRDADGNPVSDVVISVQNEGIPGGSLYFPDETMRELRLPGVACYERLVKDEAVRTDESGEFRVGVLPMATAYTLSTWHTDFVRERETPLFATAAGAQARAEIVLRKGGTVRGRVLCNEEPWQGNVRWDDVGGAFGGRARTDAEGRYELKNVRPGDVRIYLRPRGSRRAIAEAQVTVEPDGQHEQDFAWREAMSTISGRVLNPSGQPIGDVLVIANYHGPRGGYSNFHSKTQPDGSYVIEVRADRAYDVTAGARPVSRHQSGVQAGATGIDFTLPPTGLLRLKLIDVATNTPLRAEKSSLWSIAWRESNTDAFRSMHLSDARSRVDIDGLLELSMPVGRVDLRLNFEEDGYCPEELQRLAVTADGNADPHRVEFVRGVEVAIEVAAGAELSEKERRNHLFFLLEESQLDAVAGPFPRQGGPSNHRINGINMRLDEPGLIQQMVQFDSAGRAALRGLRPGRYRVVAFPADVQFAPVSFDVPAQPRFEVSLARQR